MAKCTIKFKFSIGDKVQTKGGDLPAGARVSELRCTGRLRLFAVTVDGHYQGSWLAGDLELVEGGEKAEAKE